MVSIEMADLSNRQIFCQVFYDGNHAATFFFFIHRLRAGPGGFAADVQNFRALLGQFQRMSNGGLGFRNFPPSEKESGVTLTMPITSAGRGKTNSNWRARKIMR